MKKSYLYATLFAVMSMMLVTSCGNDDEENADVEVTFKSLTAKGSATETTTALTLTFDKAIDGLTADDLTLTAGETEATKGALTDKGNGVYELALTGVAKAGEVTVTVSKAGCEFTPASQKVNVLYAGSVKQVAFSSLAANGSATETTTALTLTFDKAIDGLTADDLTLTTGETGATKGALTDKGNGVYELGLTGVAKAGEVTVTVSKAGCEFTPASHKVNVLYAGSVKQVAFSNLAANGSVTETTTALTLTFDKAVEGLTADDLTLTSGETGATKGALTDKGIGVYELALTGVAKAGEVTVTVSKEGYAFAPASQKVNVFCLSTIITNKALITAIEAAARVTFDKNADGDVDASTVANKTKIEEITTLSLSGKSLVSLAGIEYFVNLTTLLCSGNQLTVLDVTRNTKLTHLYCDKNRFTTLDVTKNTALIFLSCNINQLTALDVTKNTELTGLTCLTNKLTSLDVTKNIKLTSLNCNFNALTTLDVTQNIKLTDLDCASNRLTALDITTLSGLTNSTLTKLGNQISDDSNMQTLTITLTQAQQDKFSFAVPNSDYCTLDVKQ